MFIIAINSHARQLFVILKLLESHNHELIITRKCQKLEIKFLFFRIFLSVFSFNFHHFTFFRHFFFFFQENPRGYEKWRILNKPTFFRATSQEKKYSTLRSIKSSFRDDVIDGWFIHFAGRGMGLRFFKVGRAEGGVAVLSNGYISWV